MDPIIAASQITGTLPISDYLGLFQPIVMVTPESAITTSLPSFSFTQIFTTSAPYGATIYSWMMNQGVVNIYMVVAIAFAALMFVIGFVWSRIRAGQRTASQIIIMGSNPDYLNMQLTQTRDDLSRRRKR